MALTASATADVENDIVESLKMSAEHMLRVVEPFNRHNLYYEVGRGTGKQTRVSYADVDLCRCIFRIGQISSRTRSNPITRYNSLHPVPPS